VWPLVYFQRRRAASAGLHACKCPALHIMHASVVVTSSPKLLELAPVMQARICRKYHCLTSNYF
jgi:hypothetical protein